MIFKKFNLPNLTNYKRNDNKLTYDDIGGLEKEVQRVREIVELPLKHPEYFDQLGIEPPKGVLLYGPPGCGKTLIARAVAKSAGSHFINVNSAEIIKQNYGQSEQTLKDIFEEAERFPSTIIFFDEIDALAPKRENTLGEVEKRIVSQLLILLDGLNSRGQVIIIGATNLQNQIDPALRRPGRFDREIEIHAPDKAGRKQILKIHTKKMPLAADISLDELADKTPGFVGADLAALTREAAMACIRDTAVEYNQSRTTTPLTITMDHFNEALTELNLSTTRDVSTDFTTIHWEDIGGLDSIKTTLKDAIELPLKHKNELKRCKITPPQSILLTGKPGCGKTMLVNALATESGINFISVKGPELLSKWVGESEKSIRKIFKQACQASPSILFFDELDTIVPERKSNTDGNRVSERMVGQFLVELDKIKNKDVFVIGATNRPDLIDTALLRPGRFDFVLELPIPDYKARLNILKIYTKHRTLTKNISLENIAQKTDGFSGADIEALCNLATMSALKSSISIDESLVLTNVHFEKALEHFKERTNIKLKI